MATFDDDAPAEGLASTVSITQGQVADILKFIDEDLDLPYETDTDRNGAREKVTGAKTKLATNVHGLTFGMRRAVKNEMSSVSILSSMKQNGLGKSVLASWGGIDLLGDNFEFRRNFFFKGGLDDIRDKTNKLPVADFLCMDELIEMAYKREAMSGHVIDLNKWLAASQRKTQVILWGCIPDFYLLDSYLREGKVDNYVECIARGVAIHFVADRFPHTDPWHSKELEEIQKRRKKGIHETVEKKITLLKKHPCFKDLVIWTRMADFDKKEYLTCVKEATHSDPKSIKKAAYDAIAEDLRVQYEKPMLKTANVCAGLVRFIGMHHLELRNVVKEVGINVKDLKFALAMAGPINATQAQIMKKI